MDHEERTGHPALPANHDKKSQVRLQHLLTRRRTDYHATDALQPTGCRCTQKIPQATGHWLRARENALAGGISVGGNAAEWAAPPITAMTSFSPIIYARYITSSALVDNMYEDYNAPCS